MTTDYAQKRDQMVDTQLRARDIQDERILQAMGKVLRHEFVPPDMRRHAYNDEPLPIGQGQTISQPYIVAYMSQALDLQPGHRVLEIGTGSGYQTAVLAELVGEVYSIEVLSGLAGSARRRLQDLGYRNIRFKTGDGALGWPEFAPYDGIIVTAAPSEIPQALRSQLKVGAHMILPVGTAYQDLVLIKRGQKKYTKKKLIPVRFVPLVRVM